MRRHSYNKTSLFLIELILAIVFFAISAAICMRMLGAAKLNTAYSENLSHACIKATAAAEIYKSCHGDLSQVANLLEGTENRGHVVVYYDDNWEVSTDSRAEFTLFIEARISDGFYAEALISISEISPSGDLAETEIFTLLTGTAGDLHG